MSNLNKLLANLVVLNQKIYNFHWNLVGENFFEYHKLTELLFKELTEHYDSVAEKLVMLEETPLSTLGEYVSNSSIKEIKAKSFTTIEISKAIVKDLNTLEKLTLNVKTSPTVQPLLDEIFMTIDKFRWFFRASSK